MKNNNNKIYYYSIHLKAKIVPKYTPPYTRSKTMEELKEKIEKMEKDIKSIVANQEGLKEKM